MTCDLPSLLSHLHRFIAHCLIDWRICTFESPIHRTLDADTFQSQKHRGAPCLNDRTKGVERKKQNETERKITNK